jgi:hypothetical protein
MIARIIPDSLYFTVQIDATTFSITTHSIMTFGIMDLIVTLSTTILGLSIECHYAECHILFVVMLSVTVSLNLQQIVEFFSNFYGVETKSFEQTILNSKLWFQKFYSIGPWTEMPIQVYWVGKILSWKV